MAHQIAIKHSDDQKNYLKSEIQKAQGRFTDLQWQLQAETETMAGLLKLARVDEEQVIKQLDKILNLERELK